MNEKILALLENNELDMKTFLEKLEEVSSEISVSGGPKIIKRTVYSETKLNDKCKSGVASRRCVKLTYDDGQEHENCSSRWSCM
ncbi:MAG: hypothetical protein R2800_14215 [Flavipsychrobacter sp.]